MAVNVKMGVDTSGFRAGIQDANAQLKTFDAQLKLAETSMKTAGNAEAGMTTKLNALNGKLNTQKQLIQQYEQRLKQLREQGVDPLSAQYQKLNAALLNTRTGMMETEAALNGLGDSTVEAAAGADKLAQSMNGISRKISLDQVISGINTITSGMEKAAQKAFELGNAIWDNIMDSARMADDIATQAMVLDMSTTQYQQYKGVFDTIAEMTVNDYMKAKRKVQNVLNNPSNDQTEALSALGFGPLVGKNGETQAAFIADNWEDAMWILAGEIRDRVERGDLSADMADIYGEALFGKSYANMRPFLAMGKEGFTAALGTVNTASEEAIENGGKLNDAVLALQDSFDKLKLEVTGAIAPALTEAAEAMNKLLGSVLEYLQTPEGQEMLKQMGESLGELFSGIQDISAEDVVAGFKSVFDDLLAGVKWLARNKDSVIRAIEGAFGIFATLKVSSGVLTLIKLFNGAQGFFGGNSPATTGTAGNGGGGLLSGTGGSMLDTIMGQAMATGSVLQMYYQKQKIGKLLDGTEAGVEAWGEANAQAGFWTESEKDALIQKNKEFLNAAQRLSTANGVAYIDETGHMRDANGNSIGYQMPKGEGPLIHKQRGQGDGVPVMIDPVLPDDTAAQLAEQAAGIEVPVRVRLVTDAEGNTLESYDVSPDGFHANGIWSVPRNNYLAMLHKGERVVPAREVGSSRNYSSNLYVESMYMNNGTDAAGLAAAMAAAQRRTMSGYGS